MAAFTCTWASISPGNRVRPRTSRAVASPARTGRELLVVGSGQLAQGLADHGLVDEYRLLVHPIVVGSGKKLFRDGAALTPMRLVEAMVSTGGLVFLTYRPDPRTT